MTKLLAWLVVVVDVAGVHWDGLPAAGLISLSSAATKLAPSFFTAPPGNIILQLLFIRTVFVGKINKK